MCTVLSLHVLLAELPAQFSVGTVVALAFRITYGMHYARFQGHALTAAVGEAGSQPASRAATPGSAAVAGVGGGLSEDACDLRRLDFWWPSLLGHPVTGNRSMPELG